MEKGTLETDMPQSLFHTLMRWVYPLAMDGFITAKKAVHNVFLLLDGEINHQPRKTRNPAFAGLNMLPAVGGKTLVLQSLNVRLQGFENLPGKAF